MKLLPMFCTSLLSIALLASGAPAAMEHIAATENTYIVKGQPYPWNYNHDDYTIIWGNNDNGKVERTLLKFDVSSYAGKSIEGDATLHILLGYQNQSRNTQVGLYAIDASNAAWVTGSGTSSQQPYGASWDNAVTNVTTPSATQNVPWKDADGNSLGSASGLGGPVTENTADTTPRGYAPTPLDVVTLPNTQTASPGDEAVWLELTIPNATLQDWIDHPNDNAGVLLRFQDESNVTAANGNLDSVNGNAWFHSMRAASDKRPYITFTVPEPGSLTLLGLSALALVRRGRWR